MRRMLFGAGVSTFGVRSSPMLWGSVSFISTADGRCAVESAPTPPRPAFYVPPEERDKDDESLAFLSPDRRPGRSEVVKEVHLGPGQALAPELPQRAAQPRKYMDATAERLSSTSVHAGHPLLPHAELEDAASRLTVLKNTPVQQQLRDGAPESSSGIQPGESIFELKNHMDDDMPRRNKESQTERPLLHQMEIDLRRLEYYQGSPQYQELLKEFRAKYGADDEVKSDRRTYSAEELDRGLETQPIDYLRTSNKLRMQLGAGPRAYDPIVVMQQMGVMRYQGYAFPPTTELGKLRGADGEIIHPNNEDAKKLGSYLDRSAASKIIQNGDGVDKHLLYRAFGLDTVQRRQVRFMLSDFDHADRHTTFHVMMSYPYTDWLHAFYMVLVGLLLYELQRRYRAYEFYDEYLGLDLRQVPSMKKPFLAMVTVVVMVVVLFHPLLVASIVTTRFYRIAMRRPIGPP